MRTGIPIPMATPIAHKGVIAGALDLLVKPELVSSAWKYFKEVQTKDMKYTPFVTNTDKPTTFLNKAIMNDYWPEMKKYYYNLVKYSSYLELLVIKYPTVRTANTKTVDDAN